MTLSVAQNSKAASKFLFGLVATFATLVPGGPIETRDFTDLGGMAFWGFNAFLIGLAILAICAGIGLRKENRTAMWCAIIAAWAYVFVVLLDLGAVFPTSPDPIPLALGLVEILDVMLAAYVIILAHRALGHL
ncbi:hypothetical protein Q4578_08490 [Shimia thalassica]|uniref:hypothetical protein n=1 Tax=Shimia thalassica TaxID=1715693 RepID=UPI0026E209B7|nr:hypothetical protein [Shimia thalassica]MDO6521622.1 hypothetical protein [Shimia thalassica]